MCAVVQPPRIRAVYSQWVGHSKGELNAIYLARMLAAQAAGHSVLSGSLGLEKQAFQALISLYFPTSHFPVSAGDPAPVALLPEQPAISRAILNHRAARDEGEVWIAYILAAGCAGSEHLWYDLGLWCRDDLQALIRHNFPELVKKNHRDMKWKKFLYRQLCLETGATLCRSPSCESCSDYDDCFGPE